MSVGWEQTVAVTNFPELQIDAFLLNALNYSPTDREFIIRAESHIITCLFRQGEQFAHFTNLNSYFRMLVHRITRYYRLRRLADSFYRTVTVFRPMDSNYHKPLVKLIELVEPDATCPPPLERKSPTSTTTATTFTANTPNATNTSPANATATGVKMTIMRRETPGNNIEAPLVTNQAGKTLEEREREYEKARARIFDEIDREGGSLTEPAFGNGTSSQAIMTIPSTEEETIHFKGWSNVDAIRPFVPGPQSLESDIEQDQFDFLSVWVPQHVFVALNFDAPETFKNRCKNHSCKALFMGSVALLLFKYRVGESEEIISKMIGADCERWRPSFLPEPPL